VFRPLPDVTQYAKPEDPRPDAEVIRLAPLPDPRPLRVLDFDIENRPLSYWYQGNCTAEVTAIAWQWIGDPEDRVFCNVLTPDPESALVMLTNFWAAYTAADMVTGHYIRRHDLGIVQAALIENQAQMLKVDGTARRLGRKLTSDTRLDLVKFQDIAKSQEALAGMLGIRSPKEQMTQSDWREANRLTDRGIAETYRRVVGDVRQHVELRAALLDRELLNGPKVWRP
jgi:hypothetical protein